MTQDTRNNMGLINNLIAAIEALQSAGVGVKVEQLKGGQFDVGASLDSAEIRVTACHPRGELWYEYYTDLGSYVGSKLAENIDVAIGDFGIMAEDVEKINPDRTEAWISRGRKVELSLELNPQNPIKEQA